MSDLSRFREEKDELFRDDPDSPLLESQRARFSEDVPTFVELR
jgi:hypothetical protein